MSCTCTSVHVHVHVHVFQIPVISYLLSTKLVASRDLPIKKNVRAFSIYIIVSTTDHQERHGCVHQSTDPLLVWQTIVIGTMRQCAQSSATLSARGVGVVPVARQPVVEEGASLRAVCRDRVAAALDGDERDAIPVLDHPRHVLLHVPRAPVFLHLAA